MQSLREVQEAFSEALEGADVQRLAGLIVKKGIEPDARLRIYRNNTRENCLAALRSAYPVIERLVGEACFRQTAFEYLEIRPSRSGNLELLGDRFASFLADRFGDTPYRYLEDVARLEWCCQEVLSAAEHGPLDLESLARVPAERYPELVFHLHPAVRLVESSFPVLRIWVVNQPQGDASEQIDLDIAERVLIVRAGRGVELFSLPPSEFVFLSAAQRGEHFETAATQASARGLFDPGEALRRFAGAKVLVGFSLPGQSLAPGVLPGTVPGAGQPVN